MKITTGRRAVPRIFFALLFTLCLPFSGYADDDDDEEGGGGNVEQFERIATYIVCQNTSCDEEATPEIMAVTDNGRTLIYTDAAQGVIGFIDIRNPAAPIGLGVMDVAGRPSSVAVHGRYLLATVNTSPGFVAPSGYLGIYDLNACIPSPSTCAAVRTIDVGGQPDSIALSPSKDWAAIAVENERDEDVTVDGVEGGLPQLPGGYLIVLDVRNSNPNNWTMRNVSLNGLATYGPNDPEPEFISINNNDIAAVTMQENNHIAIVNLRTAQVINHFSAGAVTLTNVDIEENDLIQPIGTIENSLREPDSIAWLNNTRVVTANEGEFGGGGRGFTIYNANNGRVLAESGNELEHIAIRHGHYPEGRSENKGTEPEGIAVARMNGTHYLFVGAERGHFVAVYEMDGLEREFVQVLPTGIEPEGILPVPNRDLLIVSSPGETGARSQITIYQLRDGEASYPGIVSVNQAGLPIPWGGLTGLSGDRGDRRVAYAVHNNIYDLMQIYTLRVDRTPVEITGVLTITGSAAPNPDLEGISTRADGGYWVVSEGNSNACNVGTLSNCNILMQVAADGTVLREEIMPASVLAKQQGSAGFEGVVSVGSGAAERVYVAIQRTWRNEPAGLTRIAIFSPGEDVWRFVYYPLDAPTSPAGGTVNLGEITSLGNNRFAVIERDDIAGPDARIKKIYSFSLAGITAVEDGAAPIPVVTKTLEVDLLPLLQATRGWVLEKPVGFTVARDGAAYVVTDNDGLDDALGETQFFKLGRNAVD
jgi:hypothetical protein